MTGILCLKTSSIQAKEDKAGGKKLRAGGPLELKKRCMGKYKDA